MFSTAFLRWIYLARLTLAGGIFAAALLVWRRPLVAPETTMVATLLLVTALGFTMVSYWETHVAGRVPSTNFLYAQALFDVVVATLVVHLTGRGESDFAPLFVLVIAEASVLLPVRGGFLVAALAMLLYFVDAVWGGVLSVVSGGAVLMEPLDPGVLTRLVLFALLALVTVWLGDRLRRAGTRLGTVESELRQLQLDTDDILGALDTGVATVDSAGALVYINPAAELLLGLRAGEWLGRDALDAMDRAAPGLSRVVRETLLTRGPVHWFETHTRATPEVRVLGVRTAALGRDEQPWVTLAVQDITDTKRAEAASRRAERLEAVAELAASLAHEIKNPLASIRSAVEQLTRNGRALRGEDRKVLGELVTMESDRLSRLLSGFIEFSRVELRERTEVDLAAVARSVVDVARQHPDARNGAPVVIEAGGDAGLAGDADLLHRVVFNLVLNAIQHSPPGAEVRVSVGPAGERDLPPGAGFDDGVRLAVSDTGAGIPAAAVSRVFDPFFTTREGGSGLGLALVHRAVEAHEGMILIDSEPGQGTTFTVFLPRRAGQRER